MTVENITAWFGQHPYITQALTGAGIILLALVAYLVTKHYVMRGLTGLSRMTKTQIDDILIQKVLKLVKERKIPKQAFEFQFLYGLRRGLASKLATEGYKVRAYVPYGTDWLPYFYRRLRERKENVFFILTNLFKS